jgi:hypothetical protein
MFPLHSFIPTFILVELSSLLLTNKVSGSKAELGTTIVVTPWLGGGVTANDLGPNCLANAPPAHAHTR